MKLIKNGNQNAFEKTDFKEMRGGKEYRSPSGSMPKANQENTHCKSGPLQPTVKKSR